jgi:hypothetical protein
MAHFKRLQSPWRICDVEVREYRFWLRLRCRLKVSRPSLRRRRSRRRRWHHLWWRRYRRLRWHQTCWRYRRRPLWYRRRPFPWYDFAWRKARPFHKHGGQRHHFHGRRPFERRRPLWCHGRKHLWCWCLCFNFAWRVVPNLFALSLFGCVASSEPTVLRGFGLACFTRIRLVCLRDPLCLFFGTSFFLFLCCKRFLYLGGIAAGRRLSFHDGLAP